MSVHQPTGADMDEHIGVPMDRAAEIIDVPIARLRRWQDNGLVLPSILGRVGFRNYFAYALNDLVQGRVVRAIEDRGVHVRSLKLFVDALRSDEVPRPLASLTWAVEGSEVFAQYANGSWVGGRRPGQFVIAGVIDMERIRVAAREAALARVGQPGAVERRRGTLGNREVFEGTRIPVDSVLAYLRRGYNAAAIIEEYPSLEMADIEEAERRLAG